MHPTAICDSHNLRVYGSVPVPRSKRNAMRTDASADSSRSKPSEAAVAESIVKMVPNTLWDGQTVALTYRRYRYRGRGGYRSGTGCSLKRSRIFSTGFFLILSSVHSKQRFLRESLQYDVENVPAQKIRLWSPHSKHSSRPTASQKHFQ